LLCLSGTGLAGGHSDFVDHWGHAQPEQIWLELSDDSDWDPVAQKFGALVPVFGTLATSVIALLIGVPVSFGIAVFLTELCPNVLKRPLGIAVELLAGIPSIIYGMWGLFVFAPLFADHMQPVLIDNLGDIPLIGCCFRGRRWALAYLLPA
jgi:phosphate transport system permease protein